MEVGNTNISSSNEDIIPFVFDGSYKGDEVTKRASEIIGVKDITGWEVIDVYENLALLHYKRDANLRKFGHIRGLVIDLENGDIIANSFGYTPISVANQIDPTDGVISVNDTDGVNHKFTIDDPTVSIKRVFEGVVIRVIWYKGKMYRITHKKINPVKSRWEKSKRFIDIYDEAGGPTADQLFDVNKQYSSTCYHFLAVDSSLLVGTRQKVNVPYLVYIERQEVELTRPEDDIATGVPSFPLINNITGTVNESGIYNPQQLNIEQVNRYLKYGYYTKFECQDERQWSGESVIIYRKVDEMIVDVVKINSISYEWRSNLRGGNPNMRNQFYAKLNMVYRDIDSEERWKILQENLIMFPLYDGDDMKNLYDQNKGILLIPVDPLFKPKKEIYQTRESRIHLFWINYVLSLPIKHQEDALTFLDQLISDRADLAKSLCVLAFNGEKIKEPEYNKHVVRIVNYSRKSARESTKNGTNLSQKGRVLSYKDMVATIITKLLNKEYGTSLYKMVRDMKYKNDNRKTKDDEI